MTTKPVGQQGYGTLQVRPPHESASQELSEDPS